MLSKWVLVITTALALPAVPLLHLELKSSVPERDAILSAPPTVATLTFTAKPNLRLSTIVILRSDSTEMMKLKVVPTKDPNSVRGDFSRPLPPGRYIVKWRTASADGHAVRGAYGFTVDVIE
jgi:copper resistance protein C